MPTENDGNPPTETKGRNKKADSGPTLPITGMVENWPLDRIIPYARNPRVISEAAISKVAASIREFGWKQPLVVDTDGTIIVGHTRFQAAQRLGLEAAPVIVARDLSPTQVRAYRITDNRAGEEADWDKALLALEIEELRDQGLDLALTAMDEAELDELLQDTADEIVDGHGEDPDPDEKLEAADTTGSVGEYRFNIPRQRYLDWIDKIGQEVGYGKSEIIDEIQKRLGL